MLRLFIGAGAVELRSLRVDVSMLTIGRRPYNDLPLDDLTVSGEHAMVRQRNGASVIYDLNSRNGTLVNGLPVQHRVLADGDVIDIGIYRLRFECAPQPRETSAADEKASVVFVDGQGRQAPAGGTDRHALGATPDDFMRDGVMPDRVMPHGATPDADGLAADGFAADASPEPRAFVEYLSGTQVGYRQPLDRTINRVGGPAEQVAVISRRKGGFFITHLEGLTFPQINGELIGLTAHRLADSDLIELAGAMLRFRLES